MNKTEKLFWVEARVGRRWVPFHLLPRPEADAAAQRMRKNAKREADVRVVKA